MRASNRLELIQRLNPIINGWDNYYRWIKASKAFNHLDSYVWYKLWKWAKGNSYVWFNERGRGIYLYSTTTTILSEKGSSFLARLILF
ncbi:group II intron maturase-specific domain-containing protein [Clostridium formicaceticum]|uniref:Group II intron maturase-specific domain-containing protein n=1 Tax=Clostridium formicaceticum TaxID=1497 RepID=A0ABM6ETY3_9CLOT|nr:hypothetical protein BJL90_11525 [Clostridium formicaceticum]